MPVHVTVSGGYSLYDPDTPGMTHSSADNTELLNWLYKALVPDTRIDLSILNTQHYTEHLTLRAKSGTKSTIWAFFGLVCSSSSNGQLACLAVCTPTTYSKLF